MAVDMGTRKARDRYRHIRLLGGMAVVSVAKYVLIYSQETQLD